MAATRLNQPQGLDDLLPYHLYRLYRLVALLRRHRGKGLRAP